MTAFRFTFPDGDDEGFEDVEEVETSNESNYEEVAQINDNDEVIWETTED